MEIKLPMFSTNFYVDNNVEVIVHGDGRREIKQYGFNSDGLAVIGKNVDFMKCPHFMGAYQSGMNTGHKLTGVRGVDPHIELANICLLLGRMACKAFRR